VILDHPPVEILTATTATTDTTDTTSTSATSDTSATNATNATTDTTATTATSILIAFDMQLSPTPTPDPRLVRLVLVRVAERGREHRCPSG
jgi:hypothetical protein